MWGLPSRQIEDARPGGAMADRPAMLHGVQILRAVAALLVALRHAVRDVTQTFDSFAVGQIGVDIFFVISGVVIALSGRHLQWHVFLRRRVARIVPLYWLLVTVAAAGALIRHGDLLTVGEQALASYVFIPYPWIFPIISVGWTLNFEMWFYLVCTLVLFARFRRRFPEAVSLAILGAILVGLPLLAQDNWQPDAGTMLLMPISLEFVGGLWLARAWENGARSSPAVCALLLAGAIIWLALAPISTPATVLRPFYWGPPALALVWAVMSLEHRLPFARWRLPLLLGEASYALYLIHQRIFGMSLSLLPDLPKPVLVAIMIAGALVAGLALHLLVERPLVARAKWLLGLGRKAERSRPMPPPVKAPLPGA